MAKGDKVLLSPGFIANCVPVYERERMENIRRNNEVCRSLGVKRITPSSIGLVQHKCSTAKEKRTKRSNGELDDVDYRHQDNEDDHDDSDSRDSFEQEVRTNIENFIHIIHIFFVLSLFNYCLII